MGSLCRARHARRRLAPLLVSARLAVAHAGGSACPGSFPVEGYGEVELVPTGWLGPESKFRPVEVKGGALDAHMDARAYFADSCTPGKYDNKQYVALNLLGKSMRYTTDMSGAGCGCNAAFYLTSMAQNRKPSECGDHYCDANKVCGQYCAEIDIQEANQFAWHSTLHSATDSYGLGGGYGGGDGWDGPRDWGGEDYSPGSKCIDTDLPFHVEVSFPIDEKGVLLAMDVTLTQGACNLHVSVGSYEGNVQLTEAMQAGMTPIVSYWSADDMLWMDGLGKDQQGPCASDNVSTCAELVRFYNFSVSKISGDSPKRAPTAVAEGVAMRGRPGEATQSETSPRKEPSQSEATQSEASPRKEATQSEASPRKEATQSEATQSEEATPFDWCSKAQKEDCSWSQCCRDAGMQCYRKDEYWSACKQECLPGGYDPEDTGDDVAPWWCEALGERTPGTAASKPSANRSTTTAPAPPERREALSSGGEDLLVRLLDTVRVPRLEQGEPVTVLMGDVEARATVGLAPTSSPTPLPPPPSEPTRSIRDGADASPGVDVVEALAGEETQAEPVVSATSTAPTPAPTPAAPSAPASSPPPARGMAEPSSQEGAGGETEAQRLKRLSALILDGIDLAAQAPGAGRLRPARVGGGGVLAAVLAYAAACAAACAAVAAVRRRRGPPPGSQLYGRIADGEGVPPGP